MGKQKSGIKRGTFKHIEDELYAYHQTRKAIDDLRRDIISGSPIPDVTGIRGSNPGDQTYNKAARLVSDKLLRQMTEIVEAIDYVYSRLPEPQQEFVKLKYWNRRYTDYGIQVKLDKHRATLWRWREQIVNAIAANLGWN